MQILILNAGSSSLKCCLYSIAAETLPQYALPPIWKAQIDWTPGSAKIRVETAAGIDHRQSLSSDSHFSDTLFLLQFLWTGETQVIDNPQAIDVVGHRVVQGGQTYQNSVLITDAVKAAIAALIPFAPLHNPANLDGITAVEQVFGTIPQVAVFDTAFHAQLPPATAVYPIPYEWFQRGIRRYGFHGISHQYCAQRAAQLLGRDLATLRLINCHLGNGCSLAAIAQGRSVDTTMGFTPLEGLVMGSRSGSIDPGILIHLLQHEGFTPDTLDTLLNRQSGLLGLSGVSNDMRQLSAAITQGNTQAQLALDVYIHRLCSQIAALLPSLGGLDALIFTAGIGENHAGLRQQVCDRLRFLGLEIDPERNQKHPVDQDIALADSKSRILVIHTQEDWAIAQACWRLVRGNNTAP